MGTYRKEWVSTGVKGTYMGGAGEICAFRNSLQDKIKYVTIETYAYFVRGKRTTYNPF